MIKTVKRRKIRIRERRRRLRIRKKKRGKKESVGEEGREGKGKG